MAGLAYDPDVMRTFSYPALQNQIYMEFDHLYRWHSLIPDVLNLAGGINFPDVVFQPQVLLEVRHTPTAYDLSSLGHRRGERHASSACRLFVQGQWLSMQTAAGACRT